MVVTMPAQAQHRVVGRCPPVVHPNKSEHQRVHSATRAACRHVNQPKMCHNMWSTDPTMTTMTTPRISTPPLGVPVAQGGTCMSHVEMHDLFQNVGNRGHRLPNKHMPCCKHEVAT